MDVPSLSFSEGNLAVDTFPLLDIFLVVLMLLLCLALRIGLCEAVYWL